MRWRTTSGRRSSGHSLTQSAVSRTRSQILDGTDGAASGVEHALNAALASIDASRDRERQRLDAASRRQSRFPGVLGEARGAPRGSRRRSARTRRPHSRFRGRCRLIRPPGLGIAPAPQSATKPDRGEWRLGLAVPERGPAVAQGPRARATALTMAGHTRAPWNTRGTRGRQSAANCGALRQSRSPGTPCKSEVLTGKWLPW